MGLSFKVPQRGEAMLVEDAEALVYQRAREHDVDAVTMLRELYLHRHGRNYSSLRGRPAGEAAEAVVAQLQMGGIKLTVPLSAWRVLSALPQARLREVVENANNSMGPRRGACE